MFRLSGLFRFLYSRNVDKQILEFDMKTFKEGEVKEISSWCWGCKRNVKSVVTFKDRKFFIEHIGCPHRPKKAKS
jgi:hypothetical protein